MNYKMKSPDWCPEEEKNDRSTDTEAKEDTEGSCGTAKHSNDDDLLKKMVNAPRLQE